MITKANRFDIPAIHDLVNRAYRGASSRQGWTTEADLLDGQRTDPQMLQEMIQKNQSTIWTLWEKEHLLACVHLSIQNSYLDENNKCLYLGLLTVDPALQASGYGKRMLSWAELQAKINHLTQIEMTVISQRKELIQWYVRRGYTETLTQIPFPTDSKFGIRKMDLHLQVLFKTLK